MPIDKNTFCVAPWYSIFFDSKKRIAPCCKFKKLQENVSVDEYFTSNELNSVRKDLINGVKNDACAKCWIDEENNGDSLRLISNRTIAQAPDLNIAKQIENPNIKNIISFDLTLGNLCNLQCVMCNPELSSKLLSEATLNNNLKKLYHPSVKYDQARFNWPTDDKFVRWCEDYLKQAIHIKLTGGEPFIIPWIDQVISHIPDSQKKKCILHFTSNLTTINTGLVEMFSKFKEVWLSVSVEGIDQTFEYMRYGHNWQTLKKNIESLLARKIPNLILKVNHVLQAPSFHSVLPMVNYFDSMRIDLHPILLKKPEYFTLESLTEQCKKSFIDETKDYSGYNKDFISYTRSVVQALMPHNATNTRKMLEHLSLLDSSRGNSFADIIPSNNISYN